LRSGKTLKEKGGTPNFFLDVRRRVGKEPNLIKKLGGSSPGLKKKKRGRERWKKNEETTVGNKPL